MPTLSTPLCQDIGTWLKLAALARKSGRKELCANTLRVLGAQVSWTRNMDKIRGIFGFTRPKFTRTWQRFSIKPSIFARAQVPPPEEPSGPHKVRSVDKQLQQHHRHSLSSSTDASGTPSVSSVYSSLSFVQQRQPQPHQQVILPMTAGAAFELTRRQLNSSIFIIAGPSL